MNLPPARSRYLSKAAPSPDNNERRTSLVDDHPLSVIPQDLFFQPSLVDQWLQVELEQSGLLGLHQGTLDQYQEQQHTTKRLVPIMPKSCHPQTLLASATTATMHGLAPPTAAPACLDRGSVPPSPPRSVCSSAAAKRKSADKPPSDDALLLLKRQRNTDAARRSRLKKIKKMEALEARVGDLESENNQLNTRVAVLESEKQGLESKDKDLQDRIRKLEQQLREAHKALGAKLTKD
ncbi:hypothetical protein BX666DRAFT_1982812 [Dichotomocladium elegans]|nr:hypothetical protein BX666DRAFT_1982812 [Dichotomocladium elegans]